MDHETMTLNWVFDISYDPARTKIVIEGSAEFITDDEDTYQQCKYVTIMVNPMDFFKGNFKEMKEDIILHLENKTNELRNL